MMKSTERKLALATGASSGIGKAIATAFAADRHDLIVVGRDPQALSSLADALQRAHSINVVSLVCDLSVPRSAETLYQMVVGAGLRIDFLVNSAGAGVFGAFRETSMEQELAMLELNVISPTVLCKRFLPQLIERRGRIMNVASVAAFMPGPQMAAYYASKTFLLSLSEAIAEELSGTDVTVTTFCPGPTATQFQQRAQMTASKLVKGKRLADSGVVGRAGYRAMSAGQRVYVHGVANRLLVQMTRFVPRRLMTRAVNAASQLATEPPGSRLKTDERCPWPRAWPAKKCPPAPY